MGSSSAAVPTGFISFEEAIKLIQSDSKETPKVNVSFLVSNIPWIEAKHNFTIPLIKRGDDGKIVQYGHTFVQIANDYEATTLEHTIREKYKELVGREYTKDKETRSITTSITDADNGGNFTGMPRINEDTTYAPKIGTEI